MEMRSRALRSPARKSIWRLITRRMRLKLLSESYENAIEADRDCTRQRTLEVYRIAANHSQAECTRSRQTT